MQPETRRFLLGLLGLAANWAGIKLLGWFVRDWPETPGNLAFVVTVVSVLGTAMLVSLAYGASGMVRLILRGKDSFR